MTRLLLVRHGESTANRDHLVPGWSLGVPLTDRGRSQAAGAAERVAESVGEQSALLFSSDALRARQTAAPIAERLGLTPEVTPLLREQGLGDLEGQPTSRLRALPVPGGLDISEVAWGGGESIATVHARLRRFLAHLASRPGGLSPVVVLVGHGDCLRVLRAVVDGRGHREVDWSSAGLAHGEVRELAWDGGVGPE
ncbi:hypothetical protein GCM10009785_18090 [Brooklawnia cerclae]|uniref:Phosphoglycerate mutase n=1 Tax=Brooklawnia cerclae TaxID=349934 RepID=A0ABX0SGV1_9ACTN|nr:histidine phosphatase family protein [Brooklawnia cerclae]NIH57620.1 putative phosphoglycerate mutase [Brooklawnia cerclae]